MIKIDTEEEFPLNIVQQVLEGVSAALGGVLMLMLAYQMYLTLFGFRKGTEDYDQHDPESRFLVLVPVIPSSA